MTEDPLKRLDALLTVALRLAGSVPTGRMGLAAVARATPEEWIPMPWGRPLVTELRAAAAASATPTAFDRVEGILREAWDGAPDTVLDELNPDPVLVTPAVQVHRGVYEDRPVAVRVLRAEALRSLRQDLTLLDGLAGPLAAAFPSLDATLLLREVRERVLEDLDLESQAHVQRRFHRALRSHPFLSVPAPLTALCHEHVLVCEWVDGTPLTDGDALSAAVRDRAAAQLVLFACGALRWGTAHAELDPAEVRVQDDGGLAITGFAAVRTVESRRAELTAALVDGFAAEDDVAVGEALAALGWLAADQAPNATAFTRQALGELAGEAPSRLDSEAVIAIRDRVLGEPAALLELMFAIQPAAEDLWPARGTAALFGTIARVGASAPWLELVRRGLRDGFAAELPDAVAVPGAGAGA